MGENTNKKNTTGPKAIKGLKKRLTQERRWGSKKEPMTEPMHKVGKGETRKFKLNLHGGKTIPLDGRRVSQLP